jgi:glycine cleavage system H lipoate-binding protein
MKFTSGDDAVRHLTPKKDRCVWMEAGILSYLLCDREFDCDHCPLDEAMRSHFSSGEKKPDLRAKSEARPASRPGARPPLFTRDHLEVAVRNDGSFRISLERGVAGILPPVKSVVLPRVGQRMTPGAFCCWLVFEGGTIPVRLPIGGTVGALNPQLVDLPHLIDRSSADEGWLFDLTPDDTGAAELSLLGGAQAEEHYSADQDAFRRLAMECVHPDGARVGLTFQDGGRLVDDLSTMIGPVKYIEIMRTVFWGTH